MSPKLTLPSDFDKDFEKRKRRTIVAAYNRSEGIATLPQILGESSASFYRGIPSLGGEVDSSRPGDVFICPQKGCNEAYVIGEAGEQPPKCSKHGITMVLITLLSIKGVGTEYLGLLDAVGMKTLRDLAQISPDVLYDALRRVNEEKRLVQKFPSHNQVAGWVQQAKRLTKEA